MHQVVNNHNSSKHLDCGYRGINHAALKKFGKACDRRQNAVNLQLKKIREPQVIIIRNKHTKEVVDLEELVSHTTQRRNWRGIVIALVVITAVCSLIIATIILLTPNKSSNPSKKKFTFEDFITHKYSPKSFSPSWIVGEDAFYYRNNDGAVIKYNCSSNTSVMFMDNSTFKEYDTSTFVISNDGNYALLPYEVTHIYRYSTRSKYRLYNITTGHSEALSGPGGIVFQLVSLAPNGSGLVIVQDNDVYYKSSITADQFTRVTTTGVAGIIFNGIPDWVYEEEVIMSDSAIWWGPDGGHFVYMSFNDTPVHEFDLTYYGKLENQYVDNRQILYPKAGNPNPEVTVHIYSVTLNISVTILPPTSLRNRDHYITNVVWKDSSTVVLSWMNRAQNLTIFTLCNTDGICTENFQYEAMSGWNEMVSPLFSEDGSSYYILLPQREGKAGAFKHIAAIDSTSSIDISKHFYGTRKFLTTGHFDVISILKVDSIRKAIYYLAYTANDPTVRHLYRTTTNESASDFLTPTCISCSLGDECTWVSAGFSHAGSHYMLNCLGPGVPTYTLRSVTSEAATIFEDNSALYEDLSNLALPRTQLLQIPISNERKMWAQLLLPPDLNEGHNIQYSLLLSVYGGPGSQRVTSSFQLGWEQYLASTHGIVIGYLDGRGSAGRGDDWLHAIFRQLGTKEVDDTVTAGRYFKGLSYIKDNNVAIWGWSYGGYLTSMAIGQGSGVFRCGMAVAPVTDYRYYDSVYTERYMGMPYPEDNKAAYDFGNVSRYAENFKKARYMVVHGTGDDNVHFQNTAQLVKALTEADVYFRSQFYTDKQHSIRGGNSRRHLYNSLEDFLLQCYGNPSSMDNLNNESLRRNAHPVDDATNKQDDQTESGTKD